MNRGAVGLAMVITVAILAACTTTSPSSPAAQQPADQQPAAQQRTSEVNESVSNTPSSPQPADTPLTIRYGADPSQFGQLWLPASSATSVPVVVLIHGGFWRAEYGLDLMNALAADLVGRGYAAWNIEYRRVGQAGGGYPGTLDDVAAAIDSLVSFAPTHRLDLHQVVLVGHSAGGQLSLWAAGRSTLPGGAPGAKPAVVPRLAIGEAPVFDMVAGDRLGLGGGAVTDFIGGTDAQYPDRYAIATPSSTGDVPLAVVRGTLDDTVPAAFAVPDPTTPQPKSLRVVDVAGADHFAFIDPTSAAWAAVVALITG